MLEEIDAVIAELEQWHNVRSRLEKRPDRRKALVMGTLPRAIALLTAIKEDMENRAASDRLDVEAAEKEVRDTMLSVCEPQDRNGYRLGVTHLLLALQKTAKKQ